jgi:hypothetical protein
MKYPGQFARICLAVSVCFVLVGCFSYSTEEHGAVVPAADTPATSSTSTTTTTVPDTSATVERHQTTTYTNP